MLVVEGHAVARDMQSWVACVAMWCSGWPLGQSCSSGPCLGSLPNCSQGPCWCLRFLLVLKATWMPEIWDKVSVWGSCSLWAVQIWVACNDTWGNDIQTRAAAKHRVWIHSPVTAGGCWTSRLMFHQRLHGSPGLVHDWWPCWSPSSIWITCASTQLGCCPGASCCQGWCPCPWSCCRWGLCWCVRLCYHKGGGS